MFKVACFLFCSLVLVSCEVFLEEKFADAEWENRWVQSKHDSSKFGPWKWTAGKWYNDENADKGIQTGEDAKFYGISAKFDKFSNEGKDLVIQFQVKFEQKIDCGGGYVKVYPSTVDQKDLHGESPYHIMFGPDICGYATKKVHVIFNYKGQNHLTKKSITCKDDELSHVYTLIVKPDNTYQVLIDNEKKESGSLEDDWDMLPPKKIKDPKAKKPDDWDDNEKIDDPEDTKPEDWDKPQYIPDAEAKKPEDWDDDIDGDWEAPQIDNPEYKGDWKPKQIDNPKYSGVWVHPEIDNPDYSPDDTLYKYTDIGAIGIDVWQVKAGTIFDNILITDDAAHAKSFAEQTWGVMKDGEKKMKDKQDEEEKAKEAAKEDKEDEEDEDEDEAPADEADDTIKDEL